MTRNRPSDLTNPKRNSFGLKYSSNGMILGTKGDVETFFLVLNDLVSVGALSSQYSTIAHDLYRTLVNSENLALFKLQTQQLKQEFSNISTDQIDWEKYPYNREIGEFDYESKRIDPTKPTLFDVFEKFFVGFQNAEYWIEESISRNGKYSRLIVSPTEIYTGHKYKKFTDADFLAAVDDPLWLREPA